MAFNWLKIGQNGLQLAQNGLQLAKIAFNWLKIVQNGLQLAQNGLQLAQNGFMTFNWFKSVKIAFNWLKIGQNAPPKAVFWEFSGTSGFCKVILGVSLQATVLKKKKVPPLEGVTTEVNFSRKKILKKNPKRWDYYRGGGCSSRTITGRV